MPALGAGGSLVAAALVCVLALSGVVAFRGWPGDGDGDAARAHRAMAGHLGAEPPAPGEAP
jgi:hypothetical protein